MREFFRDRGGDGYVGAEHTRLEILYTRPAVVLGGLGSAGFGPPTPFVYAQEVMIHLRSRRNASMVLANGPEEPVPSLCSPLQPASARLARGDVSRETAGCSTILWE